MITPRESASVVEGTDSSLAGPTTTGAGEIESTRRQVLRKPPPAKYGALDVGTNSIHLVMAEISPEGDFSIVGRDKELIEMGKGGFAQHVLTDRAMREGVATLGRFQKLAHLKGVTRLKAVATSAVREAHNGGDFVSMVGQQLGLDLQVISAEEEARLIYLAVRHAVDLGSGDNFIVDVGGGSVEAIVGNADEPLVLASYKLGASRLAELFVRSDPPTSDEFKAMRRHIDSHLKLLRERCGPRRFVRCIVTSGTAHNLAGIIAYRRGTLEIGPTTSLTIRRDELKPLVSELARMTREERGKLPGADPRRADAFLPAASLLLGAMRVFDLDEMQYCDMALREGIIIDHIARHRAGLLARATWPEPRQRSVVHLAEKCNYRSGHGRQVAQLAGMLFDGLRPLHRLEESWRELLEHACLLHDVGYLISHNNHHKHSYYLIRNGALKGFSENEVEILANIARYHRRGRPRKSHYSWQNLSKEYRAATKKLIAMIRVANALDRTHYAVVSGVNVRIDRGRVVLEVQTDKDAELELWTARRQSRYFERTFGLPVDFRIVPVEGGAAAAAPAQSAPMERATHGNADAGSN
jgi:exopolyphosphatase / guanosine-5'-triphosphate,3'-diphosphate pyrophosphatase